MFTDYLWFLGAKQQHDRQQQQGAAGFIGILLSIVTAFIMVKNWDTWFYPLFKRTGMEAFAQRIGIIHELSTITVINIIALIFLLMLFIALAVFGTMIMGMLIFVLGNTKLGGAILGSAVFILFAPIMIPYLYLLERKAKKVEAENPTLKGTYLKNAELSPIYDKLKNLEEPLKMFYLFKSQVERAEDENTINSIYAELLPLLNKAVVDITKEQTKLIGYDKYEKQWYVLMPNPLPKYASSCANYDRELSNGIAKYKKYYEEGFINYNINYTNSDFHVPALPVEFVWRNNQIELIETPHAQLTLKNSKNMINYSIDNKDTDKLFYSIMQRADVYDWNHYAHLLLYLIPIVYANPKDLIFTQIKENIPNVNECYPIYAESIQYELVQFAEDGYEWAINWFSN